MKSRIALIAPTFAAAPDDVRLAIYDAEASGQHLYFIGGEAKVKIGIAKNPLKRLKELQVGCPVKLELLFVVPYGSWVEKKLHDKFRELHSHGEWFKFTPPIKDFIKELIIITKEIGIKWDSKTNRIVDLDQESENLPPQLLKNLLRINGRTPPSNTIL